MKTLSSAQIAMIIIITAVQTAKLSCIQTILTGAAITPIAVNVNLPLIDVFRSKRTIFHSFELYSIRYRSSALCTCRLLPKSFGWTSSIPSLSVLPLPIRSVRLPADVRMPVPALV